MSIAPCRSRTEAIDDPPVPAVRSTLIVATKCLSVTTTKGIENMPDLVTAKSFPASEHGLAVVSTTQSDGRVLSSVVNCGVIDHPVSGAPRVALVSTGRAARIGHIRQGSHVTVLVRRDWKWVSVTGPAELIGPSDPADGVDPDAPRVAPTTTGTSTTAP